MMWDCVADARHGFQDEIAAVTSALPAPEHGAEVDEFEGRLQHALEALTMEVPPPEAYSPGYANTNSTNVSAGRNHQVWLPKLRVICCMSQHRTQHRCMSGGITASKCLQVSTIGEALVEVGAPDGWGPLGLTADQLDAVLERLRVAMNAAHADVTVLRQRQVHIPTMGDAGALNNGPSLPASRGPLHTADIRLFTWLHHHGVYRAAIRSHTRLCLAWWMPMEMLVPCRRLALICNTRAVCEAADVVVRRRATSRGGSALEVRVAIIGNVDSGKSTMVGVLTRSMLDDGRGLARSKVFKHGHEESTGRTSSIGQHNLCVRAEPSSAVPACITMLYAT